ncbi:DUF4865 family protein [Serratia sp. M24T3]|uniref:DUF4865 family protein n=1 Tax=Serratia sp. M24T3 TaxID=932213 RepID=UPI00025B9915|nr:DUF4865 family protein [Serratia sp. M24T3]EIC83811.1 hypothetical protein SPM24T3_14676 [Serratia sp. M24T3]
MLAMQYSFTLPADYDMTIIERRIADNGHLLDGYPGLIFKTYLYAIQNDGLTANDENLYAPFYLWQDAASLNSFLLSPGFAAVSRAFGRPEVKIYPVLSAALSPDIRQAKFACRKIEPIRPYSSLSSLGEPVKIGEELARLVAWDPQNWQLIGLSLWKTLPQEVASTSQNYQIGHISLPKN